MATYVISDIHGQYDIFIELLDKIQFQNTDTLYILGDILDRGPHPIKTLMKLMEGFKLRIGELEAFLKGTNHELTEYDEAMVRKYIREIKVYEDHLQVCFKAGIDVDIDR